MCFRYTGWWEQGLLREPALKTQGVRLAGQVPEQGKVVLQQRVLGWKEQDRNSWRPWARQHDRFWKLSGKNNLAWDWTKDTDNLVHRAGLDSPQLLLIHSPDLCLILPECGKEWETAEFTRSYSGGTVYSTFNLHFTFPNFISLQLCVSVHPFLITPAHAISSPSHGHAGFLLILLHCLLFFCEMN